MKLKGMTQVMELNELIGPGAALPNGDGVDIAGLTADSREVAPGYLFAALPGVNVDGAKFIADAVAKGAAAVLSGPDIGANALTVPHLIDRNPRRRFALMAARFYGAQPETVAAVTGTNGKTSIASFTRQLWELQGLKAASLGTLGIETAGETRPLGFTTPDPVRLQKELAVLAGEGVAMLAMEASSHGLAQHRMDGVKITAAAFTNITRDHMDYHATFGDYLYAKLRLFGEVMGPGGVAVLNADADQFAEFEAVSWARGHRIIAVGRRGQDICLEGVRAHPRGQTLQIIHKGEHYEIDLPLVGEFQASNALVAAGLVIGCGAEAAKTFEALSSLRGVRGRLEEAAHLENGASVFIDYAHTPDALANALNALRPHAKGRLLVVFGCGGDRDNGKRPEMGRIAAELADGVFVTDDNPRSEKPAVIRAEIMAGAPEAVEIGDRAEAIRIAMEALGAGDVLVVAGKGHETGQTIGAKTVPFSDHEAVASALQKMGGQV